MKDNRLGGIALVAGAIAGIITMSLHPSGHHVIISPHEMGKLAFLTKAVHALGITSSLLSFLGAMALTRHLETPNRLSLAALTIYGFSAIAIMVAGSMSGFVVPAVMRELVAGDAMSETRRLFLDYTFELNQAFASVYVVGSCAAIILWSSTILATRRLARTVAVYGLLFGLGIVAALFSGKLTLGVHGFGLVAFTQAIWFIATGLLLYRSKDEAARVVAKPISS